MHALWALWLSVSAVTSGVPVEVDARVRSAVGQPVRAVRVVGAPNAELDSTVLAAVDIGVGEPFDLDRVRLAIRRVLVTGPWSDVRVDAQTADGGVIVIITLTPQVTIDSVRFTSTLPHEQLAALAELEAQSAFDDDKVDRAARHIEQGLVPWGYPRAVVTARVQPAGARRVGVVFNVDSGAPLVVQAVRINAGVDDDAGMSVRAVMEALSLQVGAPLQRVKLDTGVVQVVRTLHASHHYGAVAEVVGIVMNAEKTAAVVDLRVSAGPRYALRFSGNALISDARLASLFGPDDIHGVDARAKNSIAQTVRNHYQRAGFLHVEVAVQDEPLPMSTVGPRAALIEPMQRALAVRIVEGLRVELTQVRIVGAMHLSAEALATEVSQTLAAGEDNGSLFQRIDRGDVEDLLGRSSGAPSQHAQLGRTVETSDEGLELLPRPFIGKKPIYIEALAQEATLRLTDRYRAEGFLDATVSAPHTTTLSPASLAVSYTVSEGERVSITDVALVDERCPTDPRCAAPQLVALKPLAQALRGQPASSAAITDTRAQLESALKERGFAFARITDVTERALGAALARVVFTVDLGPQITIKSIAIEGNTLTRDAIVRDRLTVVPGDLYQQSALDQSRQRLSQLGVFSSVSVALHEGDAGSTAQELRVVVVERPQFAVEVGAGASLDDGPRAFFGGEVRNIFGFGVGAHGRAQLNYPRAFYGLVYDDNNPNNPVNRFGKQDNVLLNTARFFEGQAAIGSELSKVYGIPIDTRLRLDAVALREIRPAFTVNRGAVSASADVQPWRWLTLSPQIEGEVSDFDCPRDLRFGQSCGEGNTGLTRRRDAGFIRQTTYRISGAVDLRDHPVQPRSGVWLVGTSDLALGSGTLRTNQSATVATDVASDFVKLSAVVSGYLPLSEGFVLALSARAGNIFPLSSGAYIPLFKRFYLGGTNSVRGYREDQLLPADDARWPAQALIPPRRADRALVSSAQSLGGNFVVNGRGELRVRLVGDLELGTFVDVGQLDEDVAHWSATGFAAGAGVGLRYNTPVGPIVFDVGCKVVDGQRRLPPLTSLDRLGLHIAIGTF